MQNPQQYPTIIYELQVALTSTRKQVLDLLEVAYGKHDNWLYVRSRILRSLGRSGLEGTIARTLKKLAISD